METFRKLLCRYVSYKEFPLTSFQHALRQIPYSTRLLTFQERSRKTWLARPPSKDLALRIDTDIMFPDALSTILCQDALFICRQYEMLNIFFGYEQHNRYVIQNTQAQVLGYILEENTFLRAIMRQLFRTHRPLHATVMGPTGDVLLEIRRPWTFVNSKIFILDANETFIGACHQRWHLWRRRYELFTSRRQFAKIDTGFLSWDFPLLDQHDAQRSLITRNFTHLMKEMLTDAGQYMIQHKDPSQPVSYPSLTLAERAVILGTAVSIDFDYFSQHSGAGWGGIPFPVFFSDTEHSDRRSEGTLPDSTIDSVGKTPPSSGLDLPGPPQDSPSTSPMWPFWGADGPFDRGVRSDVPSPDMPLPPDSTNPRSRLMSSSDGYFDTDGNWIPSSDVSDDGASHPSFFSDFFREKENNNGDDGGDDEDHDGF